MRIVMIVNYSESLLSFRGRLLKQLSSEGHEVIVCTPGENPDLVEELKKIGVGYRPIMLQRTGLNPFSDLLFVFDLTGFLRKFKPGIVLNYTIKPVIYGSLAARISGVPKIFSMVTGLGYVFTGSSFKRYFLKLLVSKLYRLALSCNQVVFFLNKDDLRLFVENKIVDEKRALLVNGEGVDVDYYSKSEAIKSRPDALIPAHAHGTASGVSENVEASPIIFLMISRLITDKGVMEYVNAAKIIKQKYPEAVFHLLGPFDSNPAAIQIAQVKRWTDEGLIEYLGETTDVRPFIACASVYVLPSYREGLPRTILEAMSIGLPIITTDAPGCRETVKQYENGLLVPVQDHIALANAMEEFIKNPGLIGTMGQASRSIVEEKFEVSKINRIFLEAIGL